MGSKYISSVNHQMYYLIKRTFRKTGPEEKAEKADPGPLEKVDPMPKFAILVKSTFMTNQRLLISNMTIIFL